VIRSATLAGGLTLTSDATLAAGGDPDPAGTNSIGKGALGTNASLLVSGTVSESGGSHRVLIQGDVSMTGSNTFTGRVLVGDRAHARLTVPVFNDEGGAGPLGAGSGLLLGFRQSGEGFTYFSGEVNYTGGTAASNRTVQIDSGATGTITVANASATLTLSGVISNHATGNLYFKKDGPGTLNLTAANTYTGNTTVMAGILLVNNATGSGVGTGTLTVVNGATLGGSGFIGAAATFQSGAQLAPGNSAGTLTFNDGLTLDSGAVLNFQLGAISDRINVTGGVLAGSAGSGGLTLNLSDAGGFAPATYVLFDFTGATLSSFDVNDFTLGSVVSGYGYNLAFNGNLLELTATAIPEPSTFVALAGLTALGLALWRRRLAQT
jgi:autotransporter-associated beta strand protein